MPALTNLEQPMTGVANYHGCPIPNIDGDGINDELDKCPIVRGVDPVSDNKLQRAGPKTGELK